MIIRFYYHGEEAAQKKLETSPVGSATSQLQVKADFPEVSLKQDLECTTILEDQILVINVRRYILEVSEQR